MHGRAGVHAWESVTCYTDLTQGTILATAYLLDESATNKQVLMFSARDMCKSYKQRLQNTQLVRQSNDLQSGNLLHFMRTFKVKISCPQK